MKLTTAPQDVTLSEDFEQRDVAIGDVAFILDMFADKVYSNKVLAVIRELACNAHDSHIAAGTTDVPFDVHLPTHLEPWFSLRDRGTGLPDEDIANIYGAIGVSTKRDSNEVIGCFGIGSLSPYSMCDSFTVKSYLNGMVRTYQCMRDEKRQPKVIPLGSAPTDEVNGLEIKLTVDGKVQEFAHEAAKLFMFWEGTIPNINSDNVNDRCEEMRNKYVFKGDDFGLTPSWGNMYALMGNIAYKIPSELDQFDTDGYLKFDLGELEFDTARENLSMTDKTKKALSAKFKEVQKSITGIALEQIESEDCIFKKAELADSLGKGRISRLVGVKNLEKFALPEPQEPVTYWQSKWRGSEKYHTKKVSAGGDHNKYYLHKDRMQTRIKSWLKDMPSGHTMYIFKDLAQALECGIPVDMIDDLDDLPKVERASRRGKYSNCKTLAFNKDYSGWDSKSHWNDHELELDGSEVVYIEVSRNEPVTNFRYTNTCIKIKDALKISVSHIGEFKLIGLKTAFLQTAKFRKGNFILLEDYIKREYAKIAPKTFFDYDEKDLNFIRAINRCIESEVVSNIISVADANKNSQIAGICERIGVSVKMTKDTKLQELMDEFNDKYKMLSLLSEYDIRNSSSIVAEYLSGKVKE